MVNQQMKSSFFFSRAFFILFFIFIPVLSVVYRQSNRQFDQFSVAAPGCFVCLTSHYSDAVHNFRQRDLHSIKQALFQRRYFFFIFNTAFLIFVKFSSLFEMVFLCCGISCFLFHRVVDFAVLTLFLDQASPHWLTFSFPSTNDSCMYLPVCVMMVKLFTILCHIGLCFFFFCHPHPPACWVCSLHWLLSDALGGAQVTTLTCSHLCKMPLCLLSLILSMS